MSHCARYDGLFEIGFTHNAQSKRSEGEVIDASNHD